MYLNQKAEWLPVTVPATKNIYGDIGYAPDSCTIDVRRQEHIEEIRTADGAIHHTNYIYYTRDDVKVDDRLDGYLVVDSYNMYSLGGKRVLKRLKTV